GDIQLEPLAKSKLIDTDALSESRAGGAGAGDAQRSGRGGDGNGGIGMGGRGGDDAVQVPVIDTHAPAGVKDVAEGGARADVELPVKIGGRGGAVGRSGIEGGSVTEDGREERRRHLADEVSPAGHPRLIG